jgi:hypothetical protein
LLRVLENPWKKFRHQTQMLQLKKNIFSPQPAFKMKNKTFQEQGTAVDGSQASWKS